MTDKEEARILAKTYAFNESVNASDDARKLHRDETYAATLEMAEWKDRQLKEYLEKKRKELYDQIQYAKGGCYPYVMYMTMVDKIINELFKEDRL